MINNFKKGCNRLYIGNIIEVIFEAVVAISALLIASSSNNNIITISGLLAMTGVVGLLAASVIVILGILNVRNENNLLYSSFICFCIAFILNLVLGFFTESQPLLSNSLTIISDALVIASNILMIKGIVLAKQDCLDTSKIILIFYVVAASISLALGIASIFLSSFKQYISIIQSFLHIIAYSSLVILFKKASK